MNPQHRSQLARWRLRANRARTELIERFRSRGTDLHVEWCEYDDSAEAEAHARRLGPSLDRTIQRWPTPQDLVDALTQTRPPVESMDTLYVAFLDAPDAGWGTVDVDTSLTAIMPALTWMTDGVLLMSPRGDALISLDVDETVVESTIIGKTLRPLAGHLRRVGPQPLPIVTD